MAYGMWQMSRPDLEARVAELEQRCEFSRLNRGLPEDVFRLLVRGQISVSKACEWLRDYLLTGVKGPIVSMDDIPYDSRLDEKSATDIIADLEAENNAAHEILDGCFASVAPNDGCAKCRDHSVAFRLARLDEHREAENKRLREALVRLRDCDWVISLPDRMDAVRQIAREALEAFPREEAKHG